MNLENTCTCGERGCPGGGNLSINQMFATDAKASTAWLYRPCNDGAAQANAAIKHMVAELQLYSIYTIPNADKKEMLQENKLNSFYELSTP